MKRPHIVFVFSDQHRAAATGYAGNDDVKTPNLDKLSQQCLQFTTAVSCIPCCSPYRASLMTGQYPQSHGVFVNDVHLGNQAVSIAEAFQSAGYNTVYIGKWHLNGRGRGRFIPREERQGFDHWSVLECTHDYHHSFYYGDEESRLQWEGYDAQAQTARAQQYIRSRAASDQPFLLMLSWGPPHDPYDTAPESFKQMYDSTSLSLRPNVPEWKRSSARHHLAGYYAHISALDSYVGQLLATLEETGLAEDTIFVYTSDHGDMLGSHGEGRKQRPWDESILVPFLLRYPRQFGSAAARISAPFNSPDIMPTLLGLAGVPIPDTVEGNNFAPYLRGEADVPAEAALIACIQPAGEYSRNRGGKEFRGIRTERYTYVCDLNGPWLLYDLDADPYQMNNLCFAPSHQAVQEQLDELLLTMLKERGDSFLAGEHYLTLWGYETDETGTIPYHD